MASEFTIAHILANMVDAPAGDATPKIIYTSEDGILLCYGTTVPTTASTYAEGCLFIKVNSSSDDTLYVNNGTYASPDFEKVVNINNVLEQIQADYLASAADDGGGSPLLWDDSQLLEVLLDPSKGYYYFNDFAKGNYAGTHGAGTFVVTQRTTGTVANSTDQGGACVIDAGAATAAQGPTIQLATLGIKPEADTTIRMEWRCKIDEDDGRVCMGLGAVGTTNWVSTDTIATNADMAMFVRDAGTGATDWTCQISDGTTAQAVDDLFTASDAGYETFGIKIVGDGAAATDTVTFYRNGVAGATASWTTDVGDMPDAVMVPTFEVNGDNTDQPVLVLDWLRILVTNATDGSRA